MSTVQLAAGDLNRQVTVEQRAVTRDTFGQQTTTWTTFCNTWAKIEPLSGRELQLAQAINPETSHMVVIRYRPGVTTAMRVTYQGRHFNILGILDVEMAHVALELTCAEGLIDG